MTLIPELLRLSQMVWGHNIIDFLTILPTYHEEKIFAR